MPGASFGGDYNPASPNLRRLRLRLDGYLIRMRLPAAIIAALVLAASAAPAEASRKPRKGEAAKISATIAQARLSCEARYPPGVCEATIRVSTRVKGWAAVRIRPLVNGESIVNPEDISLRRRGDGWRIVVVGNGGGCGLPTKVKRDLHLICLPTP